MAAAKTILAVGVGLVALMLAGLSCASDEPALEPPTPVAQPAASTPTATPVPEAGPTGTQEPAPSSGKTAAIVPQSSAPNPAPDQIGPVTPPDAPMTAADFPTPPDRDLLLLARQLRWDGVEPAAQPARFSDRPPTVGDTTEFWTLDYPKRKMVSKEFRLAAVSDHAYWWVEDGLKVDDDDLQRTVTVVETQVYPRVAAVFGEPPELAGAAGRNHIINGHIPGVGGYVSGADPYPATVQPFSNEAPAIYINSRAVPLGSPEYLDVLAHELQHAIHWYGDASEATWLNEGLSELAVTEAGFTPGSMAYYLRRPNASLVNWPAELGGDVGRNYGAAALFAHYLRERYAPEGDLLDLLAGPLNGIAAVDAFLDGRGVTTAMGEPADFHAVFADWMVANLLDSDDDLYGYANLDVEANITRTMRLGDSETMVSLAQYGIDYIELKGNEDGAVIFFEGAGVTPLLPADVPENGCWWSNRGDDISSTLTRSFSIPGEGEPTLTFNHWYDIEEDWDYLYLEVSTSDGATWDVLPAEGTTDANPLGNSYGHGYTGSSGWDEVSVSLATYAGQDALVRFHYVTDDAIHSAGACVSDMVVSWDDARPGDWQAEGFVLVNNQVRQDWIVWLIIDGEYPTPSRLPLIWDAEEQRYTATVPKRVPSFATRFVIAVSPTAPATLQPARYRVWAVEGVSGPG